MSLMPYNQSGFYFAPFSKCLVGWIGLSSMSLQIPMIQSTIQKFLICRIPQSLERGEIWRIFMSRVAIVDTKDAILAALLIYYFRVFERRLGTRKFSSQIITNFFLSAFIQVVLTYTATQYLDATAFSGFLSIGPIPTIFSLFIPFFHDLPKMKSAAGGFATSFISAKSLIYFAGFHLMTSSKMNIIAAISGLISGLIVRHNVLWSQSWCPIPIPFANFVHKYFGQWIASGAPPETTMGATLDIQRAQQADALEQQMTRMRTRRFERQHYNRAQIGRGFAERLVDDHGFGGWQPFQAPNAAANPAPAPQAPTEENVRLLMDMGFTRERVETALRQSNNDVQLATTVLLQEQ